MTDKEIEEFLKWADPSYLTAYRVINCPESIEYKLIHYLPYGSDNGVPDIECMNHFSYSIRDLICDLSCLIHEKIPVCYVNGKLFFSTDWEEIDTASYVAGWMYEELFEYSARLKHFTSRYIGG